jgi:hypothetical protein
LNCQLKKINDRAAMALFDVGTFGDKPWLGFCMWVEIKSIKNDS